MHLPEITLLTEAIEPVENALAAHTGSIARAHDTLTRARRLPHAALSLFDLPPDTPIAPLRYRGDGGTPGAHMWVCADPVHLAVRGDGLVVVPLRLTLAADDVIGFQRMLAEIFPVAAAPVCIADRGYVSGDMFADADFTPLALAYGRDLKPALPAGPTGPQWRRRLTEAQMLLHDAPFNAARAARGAPAINGVWFWGAGRLPAKIAPAFTHVWSDEPVTLGLARHAEIAHAPAPADADVWLRALPPGKHLWVATRADAVTGAIADSEVAPLLQALARGTIARLHIAAADRLLELTPYDVRPWWRRLWHRRARSTPQP